ncbi:YlbL family protein [Actinoallomurus rhizosphaericola]|uniref:YlbL family protein n=1 Tax=Actinoallomurus rhizosphaericola TaxID=2952536 RepID=UPI002092A07F|nr:PDZ domain-containing protein [Actinoallomurus rhizosphaericola]MCO5999925.1 PDZ domain-containing protein [Actinoallomurus rhizosphaericola]
MSRRAATLVVASCLIFLLGLAAALMPVPYVALRPGPTTDTLGRLGKSPLIQITGAPTYPTDGHLNFVTVAYQGGPGNRIDLFTALRGWLDPDVAIVPEETIFPKNVSTKKVEQENVQEMTDSQESATAAAMNELHKPVTTAVLVDSVQKGLPSDGRLRPGDQITAIDGKQIKDITGVTAGVGAHKPGDTVTFTVKRDGKDTQVPVKTVVSPDKAGKAIVGVILKEKYQFPVTVKISVGDVGGPSAGLMFSLGIYDKLTPEDITGGRFIAGTGTITPDGQVGPIGGIQQKMVAARQAGATVFLTPTQNCADAVASKPKGLRLVRVDTMHGALQALAAIRTGQGNVPACPAA